MNNTFTIQDKSLSYQTVRGKVLSAERMTEQKVIRNSIKTIINTRIWLKTENNAEQDFLFYDCNIPVKENNDVTVIVLSGNQQDYYSAALMNHSLGREYWNVYSVKLYDNIGLKRKPLVSEKVDIDDPLDTAARPLLLAIFGWFFWFVVYYAMWVVVMLIFGFVVGLYLLEPFESYAPDRVVPLFFAVITIVRGVYIFGRCLKRLHYTRKTVQEFRKNIDKIMDNIDNTMKYTNTNTNTNFIIDKNDNQHNNITCDVQYSDNKREIDTVKEKIDSIINSSMNKKSTSHSKPLSGSFTVNTENYNLSKISKIPFSTYHSFKNWPQTIANGDVSDVKNNMQIGIISYFVLSILPIIGFVFLITGWILQFFAIYLASKWAESKTLLKNFIISSITYYALMAYSFYGDINIWVVSVLASILIVFMYKYYKELGVVTEQSSFIKVFYLRVITSVLNVIVFSTLSFISISTVMSMSLFILILIYTPMYIGLTLELIIWNKVEKINKPN